MEVTQPPVAAYRNFNLCPHCQLHGKQALLCRMCEGLPMISRSDGDQFHLLLADRPVPYPNEKQAGPAERLSVYYWYSHVRTDSQTRATVVVLPCTPACHVAMFRLIETVADLLAEELSHCCELAEFYEFFPESMAATQCAS